MTASAGEIQEEAGKVGVDDFGRERDAQGALRAVGSQQPFLKTERNNLACGAGSQADNIPSNCSSRAPAGRRHGA